MRDDTCFINADDIARLPELICSFANSSGGSIVVASDSDSNSNSASDLIHDIHVPSEIVYDIQVLPDEKYVIHVQPLKWNLKPAVIHNRVYRRIEGENVISGRRARAIMSMDSGTFSRDDFPVKAMLDEECMNEFRDSVLSLRVGYENLSRDEFFRRTYAYSGRHLTFAGALMFGKVIRVRAVLNDTKAIKNSLLHSDYNISRSINVTIKPRPLRAIIDNPAIIRGTIRNHRLMKMFVLSGISRCRHEGIERIKKYEPNFELEQDMLNFRVKASIHLEGIESLPEVLML